MPTEFIQCDWKFGHDAIHASTAISTQSSGILSNDKQLKVLTREGLSIWLFDTLA